MGAIPRESAKGVATAVKGETLGIFQVAIVVFVKGVIIQIISVKHCCSFPFLLVS
jgi:hypothetical protein